MAELKRGPKIGDSASLWNFTPSPGWTKEEAQILKLCLMKYGVGRWVQILDTGLLPGKLIQQLNGQTQRLLGQQSLAAYTGLQVDIDRIRADNIDKTGVERKSGLIIRSGKNPTKEMRDLWQKEAQERYGLTEDQMKEVDDRLLQLTSKVSSVGGSGQTRQEISVPVFSLMDSEMLQLNKHQRLQLLKRLRQRLEFLSSKLPAAVCPQVKSTDPEKKASHTSHTQPTKNTKKRKVANTDVHKTLDAREAVSSDNLKQLMDMGFTESKCVDALTDSGGSLEVAVEFLFSTCV